MGVSVQGMSAPTAGWTVSAWDNWPRGCTSTQTQRQTPPTHCMLGYQNSPWMNRITDRCKNITFPQLESFTRSVSIFFEDFDEQQCAVNCSLLNEHQLHPTGRALISNSSANIFKLVAYENSLEVQKWVLLLQGELGSDCGHLLWGDSSPVKQKKNNCCMSEQDDPPC